MQASGSQGEGLELEGLARERFTDLTEAELRLLRAAPQGRLAICGPSERDDDPGNDPSHADGWGTGREIRADLIRWLCVDRYAAARVDPKGLLIYAAKIAGGLDLSFVAVTFAISLLRCRLTYAAILTSAGIPALNLAGSSVRSILADGANVRGNVFFRSGFTAEGAVRLLGAQIGGNFECDGGTFRNPAQKDVAGSGVALFADGAHVRGAVFLRSGFTADGAVRLLGAQVGASVECDGGTFKNPAQEDVPESGVALLADGAHVGGGVFLRSGFTAEGALRLVGAQIGGDLECDDGAFKNPALEGVPASGVALNAERSDVKGSVFLRNRFSAEGAVRLLGAQIGGGLECVGGTFRNPAQKDVAGSGVALNADGANVKGSVFLGNRFSAEGAVRLPGAQIGSNLECDGGTFRNPAQKDVPGSGVALFADGAHVRGAVFLRSGFTADGAVRLLGAQVGASVECDGGTFRNPPRTDLPEKDFPSSGVALFADGAHVGGGVFLRSGFTAEGAVRLLGAQVGASVECDDGTFKNPVRGDLPEKDFPSSGKALSADGAHVKGSVFLREGFTAEGEVRLHGVQIGGDFQCDGGSFTTLGAQTAKIGGTLFWRFIRNSEGTGLDLINAHAGAIADDEKSWPDPGHGGSLSLDGFVYQRISAGPRDAGARLKWLDQQRPFTPQPYRQLAKVLMDAGDDGGARRVLYEMERKRRVLEDRAPLARLWGPVLRGTIGYGYYPGRALLWLALLTLAGGTLFWRGNSLRVIVPTDRDAFQYFKTCGHPPPYYARFHPLVYSLENSLPLVKLGQADRWQPDPRPDPRSAAATNSSPSPPSPRWLSGVLIRLPDWLAGSPGFLRAFIWAQILLGWLLATLFVAGVTGIVRR